MTPRWLSRAVVCLGLVLAGIVVATAPARAYVRETTSNCPNGVQFSGPSVRVVLHVGNMGGSPSPAFAVAAAMIRVHNQFNPAGGTTARINQFTTDSSALTYGTWYGDTTPTIHVGFVSSLPDSHIQETSLGPKTNCAYTEAHIAVLDNNVFSWNYLTPQKTAGTTTTLTGTTRAGRRTSTRPTCTRCCTHSALPTLTLRVKAASSHHYGQSYTVPSLAGFTRGTTLHLIAEADGTTTGGTAVLAWMPLRSVVTVC